MKLFLLFLFSSIIASGVIAQQMSAADDALLVDYYQNQRFGDANAYLKKTYPEPISNARILARLAYTAQMSGKLPEADTYYQRIYALDTTNTAILFSLGSINARRGNNGKAAFYYKKILSKDSTNFSVYKQLANLAQNNGSPIEAMNYFIKANKLNPVEPDVAYDLTALYINLKIITKADTTVTIALQADTANSLLLFEKAQTSYLLERYPETIAVCNKLIAGGNQTNKVVSMLETSYFITKKYKECIGAFQILEKTGTSSETGYYYTAMSYKALKDQRMAITYLQKAIKEATSGNAYSYYSEMGDSFDQLHQLQNSVNAYQKSLLYGVKPITYYALADVYDTGLKNKTLSTKYYLKYLSSGPTEKQKGYTAYAKKRIKELAR